MKIIPDSWRHFSLIERLEDAYIKHTDLKYFRDIWTSSGNLDKTEIKELIKYHFKSGPSSIDEEVRRYYLLLKVEKPVQAENMLSNTKKVLEKGVKIESDVEDLCRELYKYWSGFAIHFNGNSYSMHNKQIVKR